MKRLLTISFLFIFFFLFPYFSFLSQKVYATTLNVCPDATGGCQYIGAKGIQDAIEKAVDGDIISLKPGNYPAYNPLVVDKKYKYENCLIHNRGKSITIRSEGSMVLDNAYGAGSDVFVTGICIMGGTVNLESITVKQTLRFALYVESAKAIVKNFKTIDIDNTSIVARQSQVMIFNSVLTGGGIDASANSFALIENNTIYGGGILLDLCNVDLTGSVSNNVMVRSSLTVKCPEKAQNNVDLKIANNFVYKGSPTGEQNCIGPGNTEGEVCGAGEYCDGIVFQWPGFVGADENGTVCVWGEGWIQGDFNTRTGSAATVANAGISTGPCVNGASAACDAYIKSNPPPEPTTAPEQPQPPGQPQQPGEPGQPVQQPPNPPGRIVFEDNVLPQFMPIINTIKLPFNNMFGNKNIITSTGYHATNTIGWTPLTATSQITATAVTGKEFRNNIALQMTGATDGDGIIASGGVQTTQFIQNHRYRISFRYTAENNFQIANGTDTIGTIPANIGNAQYMSTTFSNTASGGCSAGTACWISFITNRNVVNISELTIEDLSVSSSKNTNEDLYMNIFMYFLFSSVFIMFYHLAINIQNFNIFLMVAYFALGGFVGLWFNSWEMGMAISMVLSLLFI